MPAYIISSYLTHHAWFSEKLQGMVKGEKNQESDQASEPDSGVAQILDFPDPEWKATMIDMLKALIKKEHAKADG